MSRRAPKRFLIQEARLRALVKLLGRKIDNDYKARFRKSKEGAELVVVCVLKGAFVFTADLIRQFHSFPVRVEFVRVHSYTANQAGTGKIIGEQELSAHRLTGYDVLIVDDIWDRGETLELVRAAVVQQNPLSVKTCVLLGKVQEGSALHTARPDYVAFSGVPQKYVIGYGLDDDERSRNLPYITEAPKQPSKGR